MNKYELTLEPNELIEKIAKIIGTSFEEIAYGMPLRKQIELLVKEIEKHEN